jgi:hypothetical protein
MKNITFLISLFIIIPAIALGLYFLIRSETEQFSMMKPLGATYNKSTGGIYDGLILDNPITETWTPSLPKVPLSGIADEWGTLFPYANNKFSYSCCPGEPRSSEGCACLTHEQRYAMMTRNGNATHAKLVY